MGRGQHRIRQSHPHSDKVTPVDVKTAHKWSWPPASLTAGRGFHLTKGRATCAIKPIAHEMPVCQVLPGHEGKEGGKTELEDVRKMLAGTLRASTGGGMKPGGDSHDHEEKKYTPRARVGEAGFKGTQGRMRRGHENIPGSVETNALSTETKVRRGGRGTGAHFREPRSEGRKPLPSAVRRERIGTGREG
jgi:hypothetical protein